MAEYKYKDIAERIIGSSMKVHSCLGNGFHEGIYQRPLEIEMEKTELHFARELSMRLFITKGDKLVKEELIFL
jgi:GxxExxY protein